MNTKKQALKSFFEEKQLENQIFVIEHNGQVHIIESAFIQDVIVNHTPPHEQELIWIKIQKIDFLNGNVNNYLKFLAETYVKSHF